MGKVSSAQRIIVFKRDHLTCQAPCDLAGKNCGGPYDELTIHHIRPRYICEREGTHPHALGNLVTVCRRLHRKLDHATLTPSGNCDPTFGDILRQRACENGRLLLANEHPRFKRLPRNSTERALGIRKLLTRVFGGFEHLGPAR